MKKIVLILIIILLCIISFFFFYFPIKYLKIVENVSERTEIEKEVILSMIKVESNFKEDAKSKKGAIGLMQVMPMTADWIVKKKKIFEKNYDLYSYQDNILVGTTYFKYLKIKYDGDLEKMLAAYNAGTNRVKTGKWREFKETKRYVSKVRMYRQIYKIRLYLYYKFKI